MSTGTQVQPLHWLQARLRIAWWVLRHDSTAFAEVLSGICLIGLRGLLLIGVRYPDVPYDVALLLRNAGITEQRWGLFLLACGGCQVLLAGSRHALLRLWLKVAIVLAFLVIIVAYVLTDRYDKPVVLSLVTVVAFYFALMVRLLQDRRRGVRSLEERQPHVR